MESNFPAYRIQFFDIFGSQPTRDGEIAARPSSIGIASIQTSAAFLGGGFSPL